MTFLPPKKKPSRYNFKIKIFKPSYNNKIQNMYMKKSTPGWLSSWLRATSGLNVTYLLKIIVRTKKKKKAYQGLETLVF